MSEMKLRQSENSMKIVGLLKEKHLEKKAFKNEKGDYNAITGRLTIEVEQAGRVHNLTVQVFAKEESKMFEGYKTVMEQHKSIAEVGRDQADLVRAIGSVEENIYKKQDGSIVKANRLKASFVSRVEENASEEDKEQMAEALLEGFVAAYSDVVVGEEVTGAKNVTFISMDYNGMPHKLNNLVLPAELADAFMEHYEIRTTGKIHVQLNNFALEEETKNDTGLAIGRQSRAKSFKKFVNNLEIFGADLPNFETPYSDEDIVEANRLYKQKEAEVEKKVVVAAKPEKKAAPAIGGTKPQMSSIPTANFTVSNEDIPF